VHLDELLQLEDRVRRKLALAAASVGVAEPPIQGGAVGEQVFSETRKEIDRIEREDPDIFEKGGTDSAAQTGEEYRQVLRKHLEGNPKRLLTELPWRAGSGMIKGTQSGHFFCAKVGDKAFLRFVPIEAQAGEDVIQEIGTCLRFIECDETTERELPDSSFDRAFEAWELARESIWGLWDYYTDPKNLQPKVRRLNREVDDFLQNNPPPEFDRERLECASDAVMGPWSRREENKLRAVWNEEYPSNEEKAKALVIAVEASGIEPYEVPEKYPKIDKEEVRLICWLAVQAESDGG